MSDSGLLMMLDAIRLEIRAMALTNMAVEGIRTGISDAQIDRLTAEVVEERKRAGNLAHVATEAALVEEKYPS